MRLPSYPLITVDPYFSIWSNTDKLYDSDTFLWCGIRKKLDGFVSVDGEKLRFMGAGNEKTIAQKSVKVSAFFTDYCFESEKIKLNVKFWTPLILEDLQLLSLPCSFIDCAYSPLDGKEHKVTVTIVAHKELAYDRKEKQCEFKIEQQNGFTFAVMGQKKQSPLSKSGDTISADWGYIYGLGGDCSAKDNITLKQTLSNDSESSFTLAFDDIYSMEYFGEKLKGLWTEKFKTAKDAMLYCLSNRTELLEKLLFQQEQMMKDSAAFGAEYQTILSVAARQIFAAHKLSRNSKGELLYMSKECHSNGCMNTVDVSYPAVPLFLVYKPELVKAMMTAIFKFAGLPVWQAPFAPHDVGRYPHANGQVYALKASRRLFMRNAYKWKSLRAYNPMFQMPVEECGNMLIMSYAYYFVSKDSSQMKENFEILTKWAEFLKDKGVVLENQLCTDDFAGHSKKNVNLAIKGIMGLACYSKIAEALGKKNDYMQTAKEYADKLTALSGKNGYLNFAVDNDNSWSLKYNMVWDILFGFNLFDKAVMKAESEKYKAEMNSFGVPLDSRKTFTKTDWMLWSACLDETDENVKLFSKSLCNLLEITPDRVSFSDWVDTVSAKKCGFDHRSVQAGLWMPVLKSKLAK